MRNNTAAMVLAASVVLLAGCTQGTDNTRRWACPITCTGSGIVGAPNQTFVFVCSAQPGDPGAATVVAQACRDAASGKGNRLQSDCLGANPQAGGGCTVNCTFDEVPVNTTDGILGPIRTAVVQQGECSISAQIQGFTGDLGFAAATARPSSRITAVALGGLQLEIAPFFAVTDVQTTSTAAGLLFVDLQVSGPNVTVLGHEVTNVKGALITRPLASLDGTIYTIAKNDAAFTLTATLHPPLFPSFDVVFDGVNTTPLTGTYDEAAGTFTMTGEITHATGIAPPVGRAVLDLQFDFVGRPPTVDLGGPIIAEPDEPITLSASVADPDGDVVLERWVIDPDMPNEQVRDGRTVQVQLSSGPHKARFIARDSRLATASGEVSITILGPRAASRLQYVLIGGLALAVVLLGAMMRKRPPAP